jgi:hypothetical protein
MTTAIEFPVPAPLSLDINGHPVIVQRVWGGFALTVDGIERGLYHTPGVAIEAAVRIIQQASHGK